MQDNGRQGKPNGRLKMQNIISFQDARVKLMYEVYAQRADNVEHKKKIIEDEKVVKGQEKTELQK